LTLPFTKLRLNL